MAGMGVDALHQDVGDGADHGCADEIDDADGERELAGVDHDDHHAGEGEQDARRAPDADLLAEEHDREDSGERHAELSDHSGDAGGGRR
jgi:hypothetical protein